jgi:ABC-type spermidine/putrescine transport system permease subunit II
MVGINGGVYEYFGAHALRLFNYPLAVGVLETTQVICQCMAATALRRHVGEGWGLLGLFLLFPFVFYGVNFGIGAPILVAINMPEVNPSVVLAASLFSIGAGIALMLGLARLLPGSPPLRA